MGHAWFGVSTGWHGLLAIPLIIVLTLIAANATALTSITPTGSLSKIPQFTFGALDPKHPATNLMTGGHDGGGREQRQQPAHGHQARLHARRQAAASGHRPHHRLVFECLRIFTKNKFPISPLAIGLGVVVPPESTLCMFLGAVFFWLMHKMYHARENSMGNKLWVQTHEPICAGIIAGAALIGIGDTLVKVFALK